MHYLSNALLETRAISYADELAEAHCGRSNKMVISCDAGR